MKTLATRLRMMNLLNLLPVELTTLKVTLVMHLMMLFLNMVMHLMMMFMNVVMMVKFNRSPPKNGV